MSPRLLTLACLPVLLLGGCKTPYKDSDKKREDEKRNAAGDPTFQAFLGRLRTAVARKDYEMLRSLMAPDFGYRWDNPPPGDNVFTYWDLNNLWPDLDAILRKDFTLLDDFMVGPPEFAKSPQTYAGYRVGLKQVMGAWRFVYFVPPPPPEHMAPPAGEQ